MQWLKSKTVWSAVVGGVVHVLSAAGVVTPEVANVVEGIAAAIFGIGVRQAIAKNGTGN